MPGALDLLRALRDSNEEPDIVMLAATDPANPYGTTLKFPAVSAPEDAQAGRGPTRTVGATVILVDGGLAAYLARGDRQLSIWVPEAEPVRSRIARAVARALIERARSGGDMPRGMLIEELNGTAASSHALVPFFIEAGFASGALGLQATRART